MLSAQYALHGLEAVENGVPYIVSKISQAQNIATIKRHRKFKKAWRRALQIAYKKSAGQNIVLITMRHLNLKTGSVTEIDKKFKFSSVKKFFIIAVPNEANDSLVRVNVIICLF